jgi:hypothetical protein
MLGVSCKPVTLQMCLDSPLEQRNALDIYVVRMIFVLYFNILLCTMKLVKVAIVLSYQ